MGGVGRGCVCACVRARPAVAREGEKIHGESARGRAVFPSDTRERTGEGEGGHIGRASAYGERGREGAGG